MERKAGEGEHEEQAEGDRIKLPALLEAVPCARLKHKAECTHKKIKHDYFRDANPATFLRRLERDDAEKTLIHERKVGADQRQQHDKPARCRHYNWNGKVCEIAARQAFINGPGTRPNTNTARPINASS